MKQTTVGVFDDQKSAEDVVVRIQRTFRLPRHMVSYVFRDHVGSLQEITAEDVASPTERGLVMALSGAAIAGVLASVAHLLGADALLRFLAPLTVGLVGFGVPATLADILIAIVLGFILGGAVGFFMMRFAARPARTDHASEILVAVQAPDSLDVLSFLRSLGARDAHIYRLTV